MIKKIVNIILHFTWQNKTGTRLKYRLKKTGFNFKKLNWSVKVYTSRELFLEKKWNLLFHIHCMQNAFVLCEALADPFLIVEKNKCFLFFEAVVNGKGEIWTGEIDDNRLINIRQIISADFHLSYPNVFFSDGAYYMLPESGSDKTVRLYKATNFPWQWQLEKILWQGNNFADTNLLIHDNIYYWFCFDVEKNVVRIFYSDSLLTPWIEHPDTCTVNGRNAGNFLQIDKKILRPVQISENAYGEGVKLMNIEILNKKTYKEEEHINPFLYAMNGYSLHGTHHISVAKKEERFIVATDGKNRNFYKTI